MATVGFSGPEGLIAASHLVRPVNRNDTGKEHVPNCEADLSPTERQHLGQKTPPARLSRKLVPNLFDKVGIRFGVPYQMSGRWAKVGGFRNRIGKVGKLVLDSCRLEEQGLYWEILIGFTW